MRWLGCCCSSSRVWKGKRELIYRQGGTFRSPPFCQVPTHCCKGSQSSHHTQPSTVTTASRRTRASASPTVSPQALPANSAASRAFEQVLSAASHKGNEEFPLHLSDSAGIPLCRLSSSPGAVDAAWLLCIFFRLSSSEELVWTGAVEAGIGPGEVTANTSGLDTGIISAVVLGTASTGKQQDISTHNWL